MSRTKESKDLDDQIVYYYKNGWSQKRIAEDLGLTENAVKQRLFKIRKKTEVKRWWQ